MSASEKLCVTDDSEISTKSQELDESDCVLLSCKHDTIYYFLWWTYNLQLFVPRSSFPLHMLSVLNQCEDGADHDEIYYDNDEKGLENSIIA